MISLSVEDVLKSRKDDLTGRTINPQEVAELTAGVGDKLLPAHLLGWLGSYPLAGTEFSLGEDEDESGLGVEMQWLTPEQMVSETVDTYPGIVAGPLGYLPVGMCLEGSGDPYFLKTDAGEDPPVVRIPHEAADADGGSLDLERIEQVSPRLSDFLRKAEIG
jgi:hypothetical protein